ncbi:MAG: glycosyltransferase family 4 protein [Ahniella sp.]|nr:glycosyltransferase family 4 protein [Ahniella sp.]
MKITLCTGPTLPVPALAGGAVHRFWEQMAPAFVAAGHDVTLIARTFQGQVDQESWKGVRIIRVGGFDDSGSRVGNLFRGLWDSRHVTRVLPKADIVVTNDLALPFAIARHPYAGRLVMAMGRQPKGQLSWYPRVDGVAAASRSVAEQIAAQTPSLSAKTRVLPYAVDTNVFHCRDDQCPAPNTVLFAGRLHPEKGLDWLIDAYRMAVSIEPSLRLSIVGPWRTEQGAPASTIETRFGNGARIFPSTGWNRNSTH